MSQIHHGGLILTTDKRKLAYADLLEREGYVADAQWVRDHVKRWPTPSVKSD